MTILRKNECVGNAIKTALINQGPSSQGKSSSIMEIYRTLIARGYFENYHIDVAPNDILASFTLGNVMLGIYSMGDPGYIYYPYFDRLIAEQHKIILCTTRSKGEDRRRIYELLTSNGYRIIEVPNFYNKNVYERLNPIYAGTIIDLINRIALGVV